MLFFSFSTGLLPNFSLHLKINKEFRRYAAG